MDDRLIWSVVIRALLLAAALANLRSAGRELAHERRRRRSKSAQIQLERDRKSLQLFLAAVTMLGGVVAFSAGSTVIYEALGRPLYIPVLTGVGVTVFLAGIVISAVSWRLGR